jgi:hypothetical protein
MPDLRRAYRRWALRNGAVFGIAWAAAVAAGGRILAAAEAEPWARVAAGAVALLILGFLTWLGLSVAACARSQAQGRRPEARALRRQLRPAPRLVAGMLGVLAFLACLPGAFLQEPDRARDGAEFRAAARVRKPRPRGEIAPAPPAAPAEPREAAPIAAIPEIRPLLEELPSRVILEETPAERAVASSAERVPESEAASGDEEERGLPSFRLTAADLDAPSAGFVGALVIERPGKPREDDPGAPLYLEVRLDALLLSLDGYRYGAGAAVDLELPWSRSGSFRAGILTMAFVYDEHLEDLGEDGAFFSGLHATLEYALKVLGYTRRAPFDLAVGFGIAADRFASREGPETADPEARLSPWISVEAGFWQAGSAGFVIRAGQAIPANVTGATASVTDVAAILRLDLSERVSIHAGYRLLRVRLRDYGEALALGGGREEMEETLGGPLLGFDVRF